MKTRCPTCRGRGHVGGWSRVCGDCQGAGFLERADFTPTPDHGTLDRYDRLGCRCGPCVKVATRTAVETPLGRELGMAPSTDLPGKRTFMEDLLDVPDDEVLEDTAPETWLTSMHENCGNGPTAKRLSDGMYRCTWPCGIASDHVNLPFGNIRDSGWIAFHDLALAAAEKRRADSDLPPAKGTVVR